MLLQEKLGKKVLIGDGAMGTSLYSFGIQRAHEELNLSHPEVVQKIHEQYLAVGADLIQSNTYAANYLKLERYGLEAQVLEINRAAVSIAQRAQRNFKDESYVLGTLGGIYSPGERILNDLSLSEIKRSFQEQLTALLLAGVDGIILETYFDLEELKTVLELARKITDLPIITNVTMQEVGILQNGVSFAEALQELSDLGADVVGSNCLLGPSHMAEAFKQVPLVSGQILSVYPNASLPIIEAGEIIYQRDPEHFQKFAEVFRLEGIGIIGGCCGTNPGHIKAYSEGLNSRELVKEKTVCFSKTKQSHLYSKKSNDKIRLNQKVCEEVTVLVELDPPRHLNTEKFFQGVVSLKKSQVDKVTLSDNALAKPAINNVVLAAILKERYQIDALVHLTTRDHNLIGITSQIMGLHQLGLFDILAITGDPAKVGDFPGASSVFDTTSLGLIKLIKQFNSGLAYTGKQLEAASDFKVAAAFNPNALNLEKAIQQLKRKQEAGADYIITQPIFEPQLFSNFKQLLEKHEITLPIFIGIQPLVSARNAEYIHHEIPGIKLTAEVRERMSKADDGNLEGLAIAKELIDEARLYFKGFYLITPFQKYHLSAVLTQYIKSQH